MTGPERETGRRDIERLADILAAIAAIAGYRRQLAPGPGDGSANIVRDAVLYNLMVIGEAVGALSEDTRALAPSVPWSQIKGLRNLLTHSYFHVEMSRIWQVVEVSLPGLRVAVEDLARNLSGGSFLGS